MTGSVTEEADVQHAVQATLATFGRIDVLVNNAGSFSHAGPFHETTDEVWDGVLDVFLKGVFRFSRAVVRRGVKHGVPTPVHQTIAACLSLHQPGTSEIPRTHAHAVGSA